MKISQEITALFRKQIQRNGSLLQGCWLPVL